MVEEGVYVCLFRLKFRYGVPQENVTSDLEGKAHYHIYYTIILVWATHSITSTNFIKELTLIKWLKYLTNFQTITDPILSLQSKL